MLTGNPFNYSIIKLRLICSFSVCALMFVSCQNDDNSKTSIASQATISLPVMKLILADLHQVESSLNISRGGQPDTTVAGKTIAKRYYLAVYQKHKVTEHQFWKSLKVLRQDTETMDATYDSVIDVLTAIR